MKWMQFLAEPDVATQFAKDALDVPPTELGADAGTVLGPTLGTMVASLGDGRDRLRPRRTRPTGPAPTTRTRRGGPRRPTRRCSSRTRRGDRRSDLAELIGSYWSEQR